MAKSNQAKGKIRQWFEKIKKEENINKGKEVFEKKLKKQGVIYSEIIKGETCEKSVKRYNIHSMEDLYTSIGVGRISASSCIAKLKEENITEKQNLEDMDKSIDDHISKSDKTNINKKTSSSDYGITMKSVNSLMVGSARCCNPVPGNEILGYITKERGTPVHRSDCSNLRALADYDNGKVVEVSWSSSKGTAYVAEIQVRAEDGISILSDITMITTEAKLPLNALGTKSSKSNIAIINVRVKIDSIEQLRELMGKIGRLEGVMDVYRVNNQRGDYMRTMVQRATSSKVTVERNMIGSINKGLNILIGISKDDTEEDLLYIREKLINLRVFENEADKMNLPILDVRGEVLVVSQFTLYGNCRKGRRPNFIEAGGGERAKVLYERFIELLKESNLKIETGEFGAHMKVDIQNDGPAILILDSKKDF